MIDYRKQRAVFQAARARGERDADGELCARIIGRYAAGLFTTVNTTLAQQADLDEIATDFARKFLDDVQKHGRHCGLIDASLAPLEVEL